jgi:Tfp pilus assembly protein PilV
MQTPPLRRTDQIPVYEPPKEKSIVWTVLAALLLLAVIAFGAYKLKPVLYDVRHPEVRNEATANAATAASNTAAPSATEPPATQDASTSTSQPAVAPQTQANSPTEKTDSQPNATSNPGDATNAPADSAAQPTQTAAPEKVTPEKSTTEKVVTEKVASEKIPVNAEETPRKQPAVAKTPLTLTPKAAQVKEQIEDALAERNLSGRASVQGVGNTLTITGKLRPGQHAALLNLLHDVPAGVKIVDSISDTDLAPAPSAAPPAAHSAPTATTAAPTSSSDEPKVTGSRVAWADVKSWPTGAEIFIDEKSTGQTTPARVQVPSGVHVFTLHLEGFKDLRRGVDVSDGGTVDVRGILRRH